MNQNLTVKFIIVILMISLVSACGFKLRGDFLLPENLQTLYISSVDKHGELTRIVKQHLKVNQVKQVKLPKENIAELRILKDQLNRRTLSVFENGQVAEYELNYTVRYEIRYQDQAPQKFQFDLYRDYQDDPNIALAKSRELSLLLKELRFQAADKILRNLSSIQL